MQLIGETFRERDIAMWLLDGELLRERVTAEQSDRKLLS